MSTGKTGFLGADIAAMEELATEIHKALRGKPLVVCFGVALSQAAIAGKGMKLSKERAAELFSKMWDVAEE